MEEPKKHGGKRAGSGNRQKYGEPTVTVAFRVPESKAPEIKEIVNEWLEKQKTT